MPGFIGSHLVEQLVAGGARVRVLDDFSTGSRGNLAPVRAEIDVIEGSIADPHTCRRACEAVDYVLHEAALPSVKRSVDAPNATHAVNATGTLNLLMAAHEAGVRRFIYAGSSSAYGDSPTLPKNEDMPSLPRSPYAAAKLAGENYTRVFAHVYGLETVVLRYFNVYGPRQDPGSAYSAVIPLFITMAMEGTPPTINGDGEQTRDFTYVGNVVRANLLACSAGGARVTGEVFNVGCGERISVNTLWREISALAGADMDPHYGPPRSGDVQDSLAGLDRIRSLLGYEVEVPLREGLQRTYEWFEGEWRTPAAAMAHATAGERHG